MIIYEDNLSLSDRHPLFLSRLPPFLGALFLETSSLTGENVEAPFALCARSILLAIESGKLDPEAPGSGISYGDRKLRRVGSGNSGSRFSFAFHDGGSENGDRRNGLIRLKNSVGLKGDGCCN